MPLPDFQVILFQGKIKHYELRYCTENSVDPDQLASSSSY